MKIRYIVLGALFWGLMIWTVWHALNTELSLQSSSISAMSADVRSWMCGDQRRFNAVCEEQVMVAVGDPVFLQLPDGSFRQVGQTINVHQKYSRDAFACQAFDVSIYQTATNQCPDGFQLNYHTTPTSLDWVVKMMIPPKRQKAIAGMIAEEWQQHQLELMSELRPVMKDGLRAAMNAVEAELPAIVRSHREELRKLGERYEADILKAEVIPLVREEILPIIEEEAVPVAMDLGKNLWQRVSLWSFTWRYLYDKTPLPKKDALKIEFQRFIDEEVLPEVRARSDEFIKVTEVIVKRSMENPRVKAAMKKSFKQVAEDPELHKLLWSVVREAVVENTTLRTELDDFLKTQETRLAVKTAGDRLEPIVREIGDMIFGSRETGITPEFSRILRAQILAKDRRWFVMVPCPGMQQNQAEVLVDPTDAPMVYPMGFGGTAQSPLTPTGRGAE